MPSAPGERTAYRRVEITPDAAALVRKLSDLHGPLMFHQSGGCCDGSSPMGYPARGLLGGGADGGP